MTYWLTRWTRWPPCPNKPPSTLKTKHNSVKSYIYEDDHHHHHHHRHTNCTALCSECVAVFISIPLCRPAKPPVPQSHLWSPGKWLIWKYNHSSLDLISFLSDSLSPALLSISLISFATSTFLGCICVSLISLFQLLLTPRQPARFFLHLVF